MLKFNQYESVLTRIYEITLCWYHKAWFPYDRPDRPDRLNIIRGDWDDPDDHMETRLKVSEGGLRHGNKKLPRNT